MHCWGEVQEIHLVGYKADGADSGIVLRLWNINDTRMEIYRLANRLAASQTVCYVVDRRGSPCCPDPPRDVS